MITLAESGHPLFIRTSAFIRRALKSKGSGRTPVHYNVASTTAELLLLIIISVNQLSVNAAVGNSCQELAQQIAAHAPPSTGTPVSNVEDDPASRVPSEDVSYLTISPIWNTGARGDSVWQHGEQLDNLPEGVQLKYTFRRCWLHKKCLSRTLLCCNSR